MCPVGISKPTQSGRDAKAPATTSCRYRACAIGRFQLPLERVGEGRQRFVADLLLDQHRPVGKDVERELVSIDIRGERGCDRVPLAPACDSVYARFACSPDDRTIVRRRRVEATLLEQPLVQRLSPPEERHYPCGSISP